MKNERHQPEKSPEDMWDRGYIVDVKLDESTRIPVPEKSHLQEQLEIPVPLENRIAYLLPYIEPVATTYTANMIASRLGVGVTWVRRSAQMIGIELQSETEETYPTLTLELLGEELEWVRAYNALPDQLSETAIESFMAKSRKWIRETANELGVYPEYTSLGSGFAHTLYPKDIIPKLRHILLLTPPANNQYTVGELAEAFNQNWEWVHDRLIEGGFVPEHRRSMRVARVHNYFPVESYAYIKQRVAERPQAGGDWFTNEKIAKLLNKDREWVKRRINEKFAQFGVERRDDSGKTVPHYPIEVVQSLKEELEQLNRYPQAGDYLAISALARVLGRDKKWVEKRLPFIELSSEKRMNKNNEIYDYYPPQTVEALRSLPEDILKRSRLRLPRGTS